LCILHLWHDIVVDAVFIVIITQYLLLLFLLTFAGTCGPPLRNRYVVGVDGGKLLALFIVVPILHFYWTRWLWYLTVLRGECRRCLFVPGYYIILPGVSAMKMMRCLPMIDMVCIQWVRFRFVLRIPSIVIFAYYKMRFVHSFCVLGEPLSGNVLDCLYNASSCGDMVRAVYVLYVSYCTMLYGSEPYSIWCCCSPVNLWRRRQISYVMILILFVALLRPICLVIILYLYGTFVSFLEDNARCFRRCPFSRAVTCRFYHSTILQYLLFYYYRVLGILFLRLGTVRLVHCHFVVYYSLTFWVISPRFVPSLYVGGCWGWPVRKRWWRLM